MSVFMMTTDRTWTMNVYFKPLPPLKYRASAEEAIIVSGNVNLL